MNKLIVSFFVMTLLTGCSQTQMNDFSDSITSTFGSLVSVDTGEGYQDVDNTKQNKNTVKKAVGEFNITVSQDVDTVFAAMINEFKFPSPEYIKQKHSADYQFILGDGYYHYETNPGSYYYLGNGYLKHKGQTIAIEMKLLKSGNGTKIMTEYFYDASSKTIKDELIARIKQALK